MTEQGRGFFMHEREYKLLQLIIKANQAGLYDYLDSLIEAIELRLQEKSKEQDRLAGSPNKLMLGQ